MSIEKTVRVFHEVSYNNLIEKEKDVLSRYDMRKQAVRICASPFFRVAVKADGQVSACRLYNGLTSQNFNIHQQSLINIWNSNERHQMLLGVLREHTDGFNSNCLNCTLRDDFAFESDILDNHAEDIYRKLLKEREND